MKNKRSEKSKCLDGHFLKSLMIIIPLILLMSVFSISIASAQSADCDIWCKIVYLFTGKMPATGQITAGIQQTECDGMVSYWQFENNADDYFGLNNGALVGAVYDPSGKVNGDYHFDGSSYIDYANSFNVENNEYSLALWFNTDTATYAAIPGLMNSDVGGTSGFGMTLFYGASNVISLDKAGVAAQDVDIGFTPIPGTWYFLTAVQHYSGGHPSFVEYYIDGDNIVNKTETSDYSLSSAHSSIGGATGGGYGKFKGSIDEPAIWNRALTADEVKALFDISNAGSHYCENAITSPTEISNLALWLKPESLAELSDGSLVSSWPDSSGSGNNAVEADTNRQPAYYSSQLNGKAVVRFSGPSSGGDDLVVNSNFAAPVTVIYVGRMTGGMNNRLLSSLANNWLLGYWNGHMQSAYFDGDVSGISSDPAADTNWYIYTAVIPGSANSKVYENGILFADSSAGTTGPNMLSLGGGPNEYSEGEIAEVIVYNRDITDTERQDVEAYLHQKYFEAPQPVCGDGNVDAGEECDDGNTVSGDGCSATCMAESCEYLPEWTGCGTTLTQSCVMTQDLTGCSGNAITISGYCENPSCDSQSCEYCDTGGCCSAWHGVTLDCAGHTISGYRGIYTQLYVGTTTINNCNITGSNLGIDNKGYTGYSTNINNSSVNKIFGRGNFVILNSTAGWLKLYNHVEIGNSIIGELVSAANYPGLNVYNSNITTVGYVYFSLFTNCNIGYLNFLNTRYSTITNCSIGTIDFGTESLSRSNSVYNNKIGAVSGIASSYSSAWNIAQTAGTNIVGGPYIGGNYWQSYASCTDGNSDGFCDTPYTIDANNVDNLPLAMAAPACNVACGDTITASVTLDCDLNCAGTALTVGASDITIDCDGHTITGDGTGYGISIFQLGTSRITVKNCIIKSFGNGIFLYGASNNDNFINNTISLNGVGIETQSVGQGNDNAVIRDNFITSNDIGISANYFGSALIYNNFFNQTNNIPNGGFANSFSTELALETNIVGGSYLGGNYWANPAGTGFSETCTNRGDGICDAPYLIQFYYDYLPLTLNAPIADADGDGIPDSEDNCVNVANPGQEDSEVGALISSGDAYDAWDGGSNDYVEDQAFPYDNSYAGKTFKWTSASSGYESYVGQTYLILSSGICPPGADHSCVILQGFDIADRLAVRNGWNYEIYDYLGDGVGDVCDNCWLVANPGQEDSDAAPVLTGTALYAVGTATPDAIFTNDLGGYPPGHWVGYTLKWITTSPGYESYVGQSYNIIFFDYVGNMQWILLQGFEITQSSYQNLGWTYEIYAPGAIGDGVGDACDNCRVVINPLQEDSNQNCPSTPYTQDPLCGDVCEVAPQIPECGDVLSDTNGMVSYWQAENDATDYYDANDGTAMNGVGYANGMVGKAFSFDGIDDYVDVGNDASLNPTNEITIEAWFNSSQQDSYAISKGQAYALGRSRGSYFVQISGGGFGLGGSSGVLYHIAVTVKNSIADVYLNGNRVSGSNVALITDTSPLYIGAKSPYLSGFFNSLVDEVAIYNRALTPQEIAAHYQRSLAGNHYCEVTAPPEECGDGIVQGTEECDEGANNGQECTPPYNGQCTYCDGNCNSMTLYGEYCGDGIINDGEACDTYNLDGKSCSDFGFHYGSLMCEPDCMAFSTIGCKNYPITTQTGYLTESAAYKLQACATDCNDNQVCVDRYARVDVDDPSIEDDYAYDGTWINSVPQLVNFLVTDVGSGVNFVKYCEASEAAPVLTGTTYSGLDGGSNDYFDSTDLEYLAEDFIGYTVLFTSGPKTGTTCTVIGAGDTNSWNGRHYGYVRLDCDLGISIGQPPGEPITWTFEVYAPGAQADCTPDTLLFEPYQLTHNAEMDKIIKYYVEDYAGRNDSGQYHAMIDLTDPVTTDNYAYDGIWTNQDANIALSATDNLAGVAETKYCVGSCEAGPTNDYEFLLKWGDYGSGDGQVNDHPTGVEADSSGNVYVADSGNNRIQKFDSSGNYISQFGSAGSGNGQFSSPKDIAIDSSGNIYVSDAGNNRIQKFGSSGNYITQWGSAGSGDGQFSTPYGIAVDSSGNVYVGDSGNFRVQKFDSNGNYITQFGSFGTGDGQFYKTCDKPMNGGIAVDSSGNVYVADGSYVDSKIQKFDSSGNYITSFGSGQLACPNDIEIDSSGNMYITDSNNRRIVKLDSSGNYITTISSYGSGDGQFLEPTGLALDSSGNVYATDKYMTGAYQYRIQKFGVAGGPCTPYTVGTSIIITHEGEYCVYYQSTDNADNVETPANLITIKIDKSIVPPVLNGLPQWDTDGNVDLSWYNGDTSISGLDHYEVWRAAEPAGGSMGAFEKANGDLAGMSYTDPGLATDTKYYYYIVVYDNAGNSASSNTVSTTVDTENPYVNIIYPEQDSVLGTTTVTVNAMFSNTYLVDCVAQMDGEPSGGQAMSGDHAVSGTAETTFYGVMAGLHNAMVTCTDLAGNTGYDYVNFFVDFTPPVTNITCNDMTCSADWYTAAVEIDLSCEDPSPGTGCDKTYYCVDLTDTCDPTTEYVSSFYVDSEGSQYVRFYSTDNAGNTEDVNSQEIKIDTIAPTITHDYAYTGTWVNTSQTVTLLPTDAMPGSGIASVKTCDGIGCTPSAELGEPYTRNFNTEQNTTVYFMATDNAGLSSSIGNYNVKIDWTAPETTDDYPYDDEWKSLSSVDVTLNATDNLAGVDQVDYCINGLCGNSIDPVFTLPFTADGIYNLTYYSTDFAGNQEDAKQIMIKLDISPPQSAINLSGENSRCNNSYVNEVEVTLLAYDNYSGVDYTEYRLNSGEWQAYTDSFTLMPMPQTYLLEFRSVDNLGHVEEIRQLTIDIEIDADNDDYYLSPTFCEPADCNDSDSTIYPGAPEIPCDGIDQNCNGYYENVTFKDQLLVKSEHKNKKISKFYDWIASGSRWQLFSEHENDGLSIGNNEIGLADFDNDGIDELVVKEKKWCDRNCNDVETWFYEWDGDSWTQYDYSANDGLPLQGSRKVAACDILGNDQVPELIVSREGFSKETKFYHWNAGTKKWDIVESAPDTGLQLKDGDTACGDYDSDGAQELIVKKKNQRGFDAYTWNAGTKKWVLKASYCEHNEPGDDLIHGYSDIALGNVRGFEEVFMDPDDRPDSDGDGIDDCVDECIDVPGNLHLGCPAAITTSANVFDCYWNNIRGKEAREGQEVVVADKACVNSLLAAQFPDTPSWESLTSQVFTHKENQLNAIMASDCVEKVCFADDTGECTVGVNNGNYIVFGPFASTQWVPHEEKVCYEKCCKGKSGKHQQCSQECHIKWTVTPEQFTFAVFKPILNVQNTVETAHLDFIKLWWDKLVPAMYAGTIVGSELSIVPSEYMIEVPAGESPPEELNAQGEVDYIYPILLEADSPWQIDVGVNPPEGFEVSTETAAEIDSPLEVVAVGLKNIQSEGVTGQAITGRAVSEDVGVFTVKAKHPEEAEFKEQTVTIETTFAPPETMSLATIALIAAVAFLAITGLTALLKKRKSGL